MKSKIKNTHLHSIVVIVNICLAPFISTGQNAGIISERIAVMARPSADSITLRWAPLNVKVWHWGNHHGYRVERYTLARNGRLLPRPEKTVLATSLKHLPASQWETLVQHNRFAGIAAQALFGERFEVNLRESDLLTIVNKVRENEQRFLFALFSADMSAPVAKLSGLMLTDKQVRKEEKYLYRVIIHSLDSLRGSIFLSPDDLYSLPTPQNLKADFKDQLVSLRWDRANARYYTAYIVERSEDGKHFVSISDSPLATVSPTDIEDTRYEYAVDSLREAFKIYYYRVKGLTPFGEQGPPSAVVSGKGLPSVNQVPYISSADNQDNRSVLIRWHFPESDNRAIQGFSLERTPQPDGNFKPLTEKLLAAEIRAFTDKHPANANYYRVTAHGQDHALYHSPVYFAHLVDSVPPSSPARVEATVDDAGVVRLSWQPNSEPDLYGYRIYKSYHRSQELAQITEAPISETLFTDQLDLNTLNETVYYSVMALDINQNHSALSDLLQVALPDKVRPQSPVFLPVSSTAGGVSLSWIRGGSEDIMQYKLYRKSPGNAEWRHILTREALSDSTYHFLDESAVPGEVNHYTLVAVDDAGLESSPAPPVTGTHLDPGLHPAITWRKARINRDAGQITLLWDYLQSDVHAFKIFRSIDDDLPVLFQTVSGEQHQFTHTVKPGHRYAYRIMALFADGRKSLLSEAIEYLY